MFRPYPKKITEKKKKSKHIHVASLWKQACKKADNAWSAMIKRKLGRKCYWPGCNKTFNIQAHHVINGRTSYATRFDENNGIPICWGHHNFRAETKTGIQILNKIMINLIGKKEFKRIESLAFVSPKYSQRDLQEITFVLNSKYKGENNNDREITA